MMPVIRMTFFASKFAKLTFFAKKLGVSQKSGVHLAAFCIENLWAIVCKRVAIRQPLCEKELAQFLKEEWEGLPQTMVDNLVLSFKGRLQECVRLGGETIFTKEGDR